MMRKLLLTFNTISIFSTSSLVVSCQKSEPHDQTKITLSVIKTELALVPIITSQQTVTEIMFQDVIYRALETDDFRGTVNDNELVFTYYNNGVVTPWKDLSLTERIVKTEPVELEISAASDAKHFLDKTPRILTTLYQEEVANLADLKLIYDINDLKELPENELQAYFELKNKTIFFNNRHVIISKTPTAVTIKAVDTSDRYKGTLTIEL
ncbi:hypothetical protein SSYRP_v1c04150 [Spiroplasma syrphidicola EA-1]|uniref:Lipoprotein n=1 Tax=Spiroplasma syrphidicola EA-1 TaxID=1276229 RepID=R4U5X9_9MOLU|nr:hypothetical protein [Spiroplasma syrphidicola]AGM26008.1 hypothetical protein SSYRP_v1c04150 [Spiroplasma syrphidicola EA-1]